jgi:hypothetical protein
MRRSWTSPEDETLRRLITIHGKQWGLISTQMENRTASQISARWEKCLDPKLAKGPFTPEEDSLILSHVEKHGPQNWPILSQILIRRSPKQCRERWFNHLNPSVSASSWSFEEDSLIFENYERIGPKWSLISKSLNGRTDNAIKNRWNSSIVKRIHIGGNGKRFVVPDNLRRKKKSEKGKGKTERPPAIETEEEGKGGIEGLADWNLQILQQMNVVTMEGGSERPLEWEEQFSGWTMNGDGEELEGGWGEDEKGDKCEI